MATKKHTLTVWKTTDPHGKTHGGTQWDIGVTHTEVGDRTSTGGRGWLHAYRTLDEAIMCHHAKYHQIPGYRVFRCTADVSSDSNNILLCTRITVDEEIDVAVVAPGIIDAYLDSAHWLDRAIASENAHASEAQIEKALGDPDEMVVQYAERALLLRTFDTVEVQA